MARVTVEDCLENVANRFELVMVASKRARQISTGAKDPLVEEASDKPTVMRMVSNVLPSLKFGDPIDTSAKAKIFDENDTNRENMYYNLQEKSDAKYMFMVSIKDIKAGEELCANYNLYTYPKTGVGIQML